MKEKTNARNDASGEQETETTIRMAKERSIALGVESVVVASTTGRTAIKACGLFKGMNLVVVRHHTGFQMPGAQQMTPQSEELILRSGARIVTAAHALSGVERSIRRKHDTVEPLELMADTLRIFGQGTKVCIEIVVMAADAGMIPVDKPVIAIAGTDNGADTALVIHPAHSNNFFDLFVSEVITKPFRPSTTLA